MLPDEVPPGEHIRRIQPASRHFIHARVEGATWSGQRGPGPHPKVNESVRSPPSPGAPHEFDGLDEERWCEEVGDIPLVHPVVEAAHPQDALGATWWHGSFLRSGGILGHTRNPSSHHCFQAMRQRGEAAIRETRAGEPALPTPAHTGRHPPSRGGSTRARGRPRAPASLYWKGIAASHLFRPRRIRFLHGLAARASQTPGACLRLTLHDDSACARRMGVAGGS